MSDAASWTRRSSATAFNGKHSWNWRPEIFNYFDTPITNAFTEALNGLAKIANRMGRGYSFEAIRAKLLFGPAKQPGKRKPPFGVDPALSFGCYDRRDLGVFLPQLIELWEMHHSSTLNSG